jgi:hypothetical protein
VERCSEVSAAGHRADFERERERCDTLMPEALMLAKVAMSARGQGHMFSAGVDLLQVSAGGADYIRRFLRMLHRM